MLLSDATGTEKHSKRGNNLSLVENIDAKPGLFVSKFCKYKNGSETPPE